MHDETTMQAQSETTGGVETKHFYYEVSGDLLAKPNALCEALEAAGAQASVIFCNSPSDADLVDVLLKKRGMKSQKLIGNVPPMVASRALRELKSGELNALVVTDIASREIDVEQLELVVNYSMPSDPEVYLHRSSRSGPTNKLAKVISLISPLDIANFHYLKKFVDFEFHLLTPPTKEQLLSLKVKQMQREAASAMVLNDPRLKELTAEILADSGKEEIVALLLRNTLDVLPGLKAAAEDRSMRSAQPSHGEGFDEERSFEQGSGGGRERRRGGRDDRGGRDGRGGRGGRDDRGGRGGRDDRGGRGGQRNGSGYRQDLAEREGFGPGDQAEFDESAGPGNGDGWDNRRARGEDGGDRSRGQGRDRGGRRGERGGRGRNDRNFDEGRSDRGEQREQQPPAPRDVRLYIGHGNRQGFNEQKFIDLLAKHAELTPEQVRRFSLRDCYSFADFSNELADTVCEKLNEVPVDGDGKLFIRRAIALGTPRDEMRRGGGGHRREEGDMNLEFNDSGAGDESVDSFEEHDEMGNR